MSEFPHNHLNAETQKKEELYDVSSLWITESFLILNIATLSKCIEKMFFYLQNFASEEN